MEHIFDVRTKEEYESGAVKGATNMPVEEILAGGIPLLEKDAEIGVYCRSGGRSAVAKEVFEKHGFTPLQT